MQRIAHAEGRQIRYPILTNPEGEINRNRGKWQAAVRSIVELAVDRSIREYRKEPWEWKWLLRTIQRGLDLQFSFVYPVKPEVLSPYLSLILSNDRYKWHKHYVLTSGGQHEDCPDEAFEKLRRFWETPEGKAKNKTMSRICSKVGKDVSFCRDQGLEVTPTPPERSKTALDKFHTPDSYQVHVGTFLYVSLDYRFNSELFTYSHFHTLDHCQSESALSRPCENLNTYIVATLYANPYGTPMCSVWVMDAPTEYGATVTYGSHAHSPKVVNSISMPQVCQCYVTTYISSFHIMYYNGCILTFLLPLHSQGTPSYNQSTLVEKLSNAWKAKMETRMDFLQNNLTELLQMIKNRAVTENRTPDVLTPPCDTFPSTPTIPISMTPDVNPHFNNVPIPQSLTAPRLPRKSL